MTIAFDHVAIATHRIQDAPDLLVGELGGRSGFGSPSGEYSWWHWDFPGGGRIEVLEPFGPPGGFVHRFLEARGPGIHHVTFKVPSLRRACDRAEKLGYSVVGYDDSHEHWKEAFLHPREAMGIVVQFAESSGEDPAERLQAGRPPEPTPARTAARVIGVRLRSADRMRAVRQWGELLEGQLEERPDELRFGWPTSGMRVAVTIAPGAPDASEAIEVTADRVLDLPEGPHPVLGAEFRQL